MNYFEVEAVSSSEIRSAIKSEKHWRAYKNGEHKKSSAFELGTLVHMRVLERDRFDSLPVWVGRRFGKSWDDFVEKHGDDYVNGALLEEVVRISDSADQCLSRNGINKLGNALLEKEVFVERFTHKCKAKIDIYQKGRLVELKTTRDCSPTAFSRDVFKFGYLNQLAWYSIVLSRSTGISMVDQYSFCVVSTEAPYDYAWYNVPSEMMEIAKETVLEAENKISTWMKSENPNPDGEFPAAMDLLIPAWAIPQEDELTFGGESIF